ncbi:uncharacterized protein LOC135704926 [Ochlerotatus camptorhynchus]|uniref:uncharacterized protein LOC135704926 n=1 Tax=Ochlerotatus camptorhynchus TaxID=644619 RepID=UPI0031D4FB7D
MSKRKPHENSCQQEVKKSKDDAPPEQVANTDWDIDSYRSHYEPEEHWDLRRRFMECHQNWIAEDDLVCLAQVFVNVELLHCRYPLETMERLKELSKGIADEYRDSRKNKLQRTFVSASDAAASKVQRKGPGEQVQQRNAAQATASRKHKPVQPISNIEDVYNNIVLMNNDYEQTQIEFDRLGRDKMIIMFSKNPQGKTIGEVKVGQFILAKTEADGEKAARKAVKLDFLQLMTQHCYSVIRKKRPTQLTNTNVERKQVEGAVDHRGRKVVQDYQEKKIDESNLGFKLLQKLGWSGGSLGSKNQGIVDPINCQIKIGRQGLGGGPSAKKQGEEASKKGKINTRNETYGIDINFYRQMMRNFKDSELEYDLVFSNEFTKEERALFHNMAQQLQLKTRSYGNDNDGSRQFVLLGRKVPPHELLERVLVQQDPIFCEMYNVEPPNGTQKDEPKNRLQDETDQPHPEIMTNNANHLTEFTPIIPIQTVEDLHNNIVLVDRNFIQTKREFELLQCGKMEVLVTPMENKSGMFEAKVQVGAFVLAETEAMGRRRAEVAAQRRFMKEMGNWCYRIIRQKKSALIVKTSVHRSEVNDYKDKTINDSNLGFKMLQKQGWSGGALGLKGDGILEPIAYQKGFQGFDQDRAKQFVARKQNAKFDVEHYMQIIQDFRDNGDEYDLIFSAEFSKEERAQFHEIADDLGLMSRSFGSDKQGRHLLFYGKKLSMHEILQRVFIQKDSFISEMYKVQLPNRKFE